MKLSRVQREELKQKYDGHCAYCGDLLTDKWHADHLNSIRRNGDGTCLNPENDVVENLVPACTPCNHNKRSMSLESWRDLLAHYRDVQVIRDCSQVRHLMRFGLIEFNPKPVLFYFETFRNEIPSVIIAAEKCHHGYDVACLLCGFGFENGVRVWRSEINENPHWY